MDAPLAAFERASERSSSVTYWIGYRNSGSFLLMINALFSLVEVYK